MMNDESFNMFSKKSLLLFQIIHVKWYPLIYKQYLLCKIVTCFFGGFAAKCRIAKSYIAYVIEVILSVFNVVKEKPNIFGAFATN